MTLPHKRLADMPDSVYASAWTNRPGFLGWLFRKLEEYVFYAYFTCVLAGGASGVAVLVIVGGGRLFGAQDWGVWILAPSVALTCATVLLVVVHLLSAAMAVPRKDRSFPLVHSMQSSRECAAYNYVASALAAVVFGILIASGTTPATLMWIGFGSSAAIFAINFMYSRFLPTWGFRVASEQEYEFAARMRREQGREAQAEASKNDEDYPVPVRAVLVRTRFSDIHGMAPVKSRILNAAKEVIGQEQGTQRNGILLHGAPGNGKTVFAEALAGELGVPLITVTYGDVSSKWLGEVPRVLSGIFRYARANAPCVLFVDEIDSFLRSRDSSGRSGEDDKITNTLLTEIVALRRANVVLVGATNFLDRLDAAAIREGRFDYKVEITPPDEEARIGLLRSGLAKHAQSCRVDEQALKLVAARWEGAPVSRLLAVSKELSAVCKPDQFVRYDDWIAALRLVQGRKGEDVKHAKGLNDLVLSTDTREALDMISSRLRDVQRIHELGGTLPTGVLFFGPSGTGKTAAARALAKDSGWSFMSVAGPDLLSDRKALEKLYADAREMQPVIVFIDEGDDVLRNRQFGGNTEVVNKLLVLMDGGGSARPDVVVIAATNNPDQIDPALLRAGRFTEKLRFEPPPADLVPKTVSTWLKSKKALLAPGLDPFDVAERLPGASVATVEGVLQYALNRAINRTSAGAVSIGSEDIDAAVRVVCADQE